MQKFIRKLLKMDEKQDVSLSSLFGVLTALIATIIIMFFAFFSKRFELMNMGGETLFLIAVIASISNAIFALNFYRLEQWAGLSAKSTPSRTKVFILCSIGTAAFILYFILAKLIL